MLETVYCETLIYHQVRMVLANGSGIFHGLSLDDLGTAGNGTEMEFPTANEFSEMLKILREKMEAMLSEYPSRFMEARMSPGNAELERAYETLLSQIGENNNQLSQLEDTVQWKLTDMEKDTQKLKRTIMQLRTKNTQLSRAVREDISGSMEASEWSQDSETIYQYLYWRNWLMAGVICVVAFLTSKVA